MADGGVAGGAAAGAMAGSGGAPSGARKVPDASNSPRLCSDLFDQSIVPAYSFEISADNWAKLDADFHDLKDVLAGTPPQTYYPIVFHYGSETVSNAAVRLRGKSSWVNTVMFDTNPKMQFDISFDQIDTSQKFHGVSTIHLEMARDDWTFLNERIGNNWFREIGLLAPCSNSATVTVNGTFYGLYVAEEGVNKSLLKQFFPATPTATSSRAARNRTRTRRAQLDEAPGAEQRLGHRDTADAGRSSEHRPRVGGGGGRGRRRRILRRLAQLLDL